MAQRLLAAEFTVGMASEELESAVVREHLEKVMLTMPLLVSSNVEEFAKLLLPSPSENWFLYLHTWAFVPLILQLTCRYPHPQPLLRLLR